MNIQSTTGGRDAAAGLTGSGASGELGKQEFLQLLVLQLKNQDPLDPMDNREFISQMAQLSALEATTGLSTQVQELVAAQYQTQALTMVGRQVEYTDANGETQRGQVTGVQLFTMPPMLVIGEREVPINRVQRVL